MHLFGSLAFYRVNVNDECALLLYGSHRASRRSKKVNSIEMIAVEQLFEEEGILAGDILSPAGVLLLPSGLDLDSLRSARPDAIELLQRHGLDRVPVKKHEPITVEEFQRLISSLTPPISRLNPLLSRVIAHQMGAIYTSIGNRELREEGVRSLFSIGGTLASEVRRIPQITLSLSEDSEGKLDAAFHGVNVALVAGHIASRIFPLWPDFIRSVTIGGLFHDIGKAFILFSGYSADILKMLRDDRITQTHPLLGEALLRDAGIRSMDILSSVRSHHEVWDGSGYPDGLTGENIPVGARIIGVANVFHNVLSEKGEGKKRSDQAISSLIASTLGRFDHFIVRALLSSVGLFPPGSVVELSDGRNGIVLETRERNLIRPKILLMTGLRRQRELTPEIVDLRVNTSVSIRRAIDDFGAMTVPPLAAVGEGRTNVLFRKYRSPAKL